MQSYMHVARVFNVRAAALRLGFSPTPTRSQHTQLLAGPAVKLQQQLRIQGNRLFTQSSSRQAGAGATEPDPLSPEATRRHLRSILLQIHPDRFSSHQAEQHSNSEALKLLNAYLDHAAEGKWLDAFTLRFFIKEEPAGSFKAVSVAMPGNGSLAPLFHAFGLIGDAELRGVGSGGADDDGQQRETMRDLLAWLSQHMAEVSRTQHEYAKEEAKLEALKSAIKHRFRLNRVAVGRCWDDQTVPQLHRRTVQLKALESCLLKLQGAGASFSGLIIYLRDSSDSDLAGGRRVRLDPLDGSVSVLAGSSTLEQELASLDPSWARSLALSSKSFGQMVEGLLGEAASLLGVGSVRFNIGDTIQPGHKSLIWVQSLLADRQMVKAAMARCTTPHRELSSITIKVESNKYPRPRVHPHIPILLCVGNSCSIKALLEFLCSDAGSVAARGAYADRTADLEDEQLFGRVKEALGCRHVSVSTSISLQPDRSWRRASQLLLDNSRLLRSSVDLRGIMLRFGEKYEITAEMGSITIPCDFEAEDLTRQLRRLMAPQPLRLQAGPTQESELPPHGRRRQGS